MSKKLTKGDLSETYIFGVCSGLGNYFSIDPTIIRIIFVIGVLYNNWILIIYLILALIIPNKD